MKTPRVTENDIIQVLTGEAGHDLEERVRAAVETDRRLSRLYTEWSALIPLLEGSLAPARAIEDRVKNRVMERLGEVPAAQRHPSETSRWRPLLEALWGSAPAAGERRRTLLSSLAVVAPILVVLLIWAAGTHYRHSTTIRFYDTVGSVKASPLNGIAAVTNPLDGARLKFPATVQTLAASSVTVEFPDGDFVRLEEDVSLEISGPREVRQASGTASYMLMSTGSKGSFTIRLPAGQVVDLGTSFDITVEDDGLSVIEVFSGKILLVPDWGEAKWLAEGGRGVLTRNGASIQMPASGQDSRARQDSAVSDQGGERGTVWDAPFNPVLRNITGFDALVPLVVPQRVALRPGAFPPALRQLPPFTMDQPLGGALSFGVDARRRTIAVAMDRKLDGKFRLYLDADGDGDLTNDPVFDEGKDFLVGTDFDAGQLPGGLTAHLRLVSVGEDRAMLEFRNLAAYEAIIPAPEKNDGPGEWLRVVLLDSDSDGDFFESGTDASPFAWMTTPSVQRPGTLHGVTALGESIRLLGQEWEADRDSTGAFHIHHRPASQQGDSSQHRRS